MVWLYVACVVVRYVVCCMALTQTLTQTQTMVSPRGGKNLGFAGTDNESTTLNGAMSLTEILAAANHKYETIMNRRMVIFDATHFKIKRLKSADRCIRPICYNLGGASFRIRGGGALVGEASAIQAEGGDTRATGGWEYIGPPVGCNAIGGEETPFWGQSLTPSPPPPGGFFRMKGGKGADAQPPEGRSDPFETSCRFLGKRSIKSSKPREGFETLGFGHFF